VVKPRAERLGLALVCLLALGLRLWFVTAGSVQDAVQRSDSFAYVKYALNLAHSQVYSMSTPGSGPLLPDSFRDPGYPVFLAALLLLLGFTQKWYAAVLGLQAVLGALTAGLTVRIARRWLPAGAALGAGALVAIWPHNVAFTAFLLSETLCGFMLALALWLGCRAGEAGTRRAWLGAGFAFGLAAMVNAVVTPLAPLLALLCWRRRALAPALALALAGGALLLPAAWAVRGWSIEGGAVPGRAVINLVQGSWPEYHQAYIGGLNGDPHAREVLDAIAREQQLMQSAPRDGAAAIAARLRAEPGRYLAWYAGKPVLLWAWSIRMGWGDIYAYPVDHSIYLSNPLMPAVEALCFALNPVLFLLMAAAALLALLRPVPSGGAIGLYIAAALAVLETLVYSVLQAEPRYSIPLRPFEMILAVSLAAELLRLRRARLLRRGPGRRPGAAPPTSETAPRGVI
jgi:hypothetical protein